MKRQWRLLALFFILGCLSPIQAAEIRCVVNFGEQQCGPFKLLSGVIVKAVLSKAQVQQRFGRGVTQLAMLGEESLYLIPSDDPSRDAEVMSKEAGVLYAQPDVVQTRFLQSRSLTPGDYSVQPYLTDIGYAFRALPEKWLSTGGEGVKIAVIDDGFNLEHEDLQGATLGFSYDAELKRTGAAPQAHIDHHGTQVAGVLVAQHNGKGSDGIAPKATLIPIRQVSTRTSDTILSFTVADLAGADIINCSWNSQVLMEPVRDVIEYLSRWGRGGLGTVIVFAAGNEGKTLLPGSQEAAIPSVISVGSQVGGRIAPYSNYGSSVDLYLPGRFRTTYNQGYGWFDGTSASAALGSGLAALILARKPGMTLNELRGELVADVARIWPLPLAVTNHVLEEGF